MANNIIPTTHIIGQGVIGSLLTCNGLRQQLPVLQYARAVPQLARVVPQLPKTVLESLSSGNQPLGPAPVTVHYLPENQYTLPRPVTLPHKNDTDQHLTGLIIIPVKAYQMEQALTQLHGLLAADATLLLLHNGMGSIDFATQLFPYHSIIAGTTTLAGYKKEHLIKHTALGQTQCGIVSNPLAPPPNPEHVNLINQLVPKPTWHNNILYPLFTKLTINCVINPLTAIHNIQNGQLSNPEFVENIPEIVQEVVNVAALKGVTLNSEHLIKQVLSVIDETRNNFSSMHQDIAHGRKSEIEQINGYVVALGEQHGVEVTCNKALLQQILGKEKAAI